MKLSDFINQHMSKILSDWDQHAGKSTPAADHMSTTALRDHAEKMLRAIARDIDSSQTSEEEYDKSQGSEDSKSSAASTHGGLRYDDQFSLRQLTSEFRALRAGVLRLWLPQVRHTSPETIDDIVRFNEAIDQAVAESVDAYAARAEDARDLFAAMLGHDLRAPLATMSYAGTLLTQTASTGESIAEVGTRVTHASRHMTRMVDDLLGYTRTRLGGGIPITLQHVDVEQLCGSAIADAAAMHSPCTFQLQTSGDLEGTFDGVRLRQLLTNLLVNACQYGAGDRPVRIRASGEVDSIEIVISNEGPPIPEEDLRRIFRPMVRLQAEGDRGTWSDTSLGLGLFIAREVAKGHGGTISVASSEAEGTAFTVRLPRHRLHATRTAGISSPI